MKQAIVLVVFTTMLFQSHPAWSAFGLGDVVFDPTNWSENAMQVIHTLEIIKNQLTDLHALVVFPIVSIAQDFMRLTSLLNEIKGLMGFDEAGVRGLFTGMFGVIPCTENEFVAWLASESSVMRQAYEGAMLAQTLVNDIFELLNCITGIIDQVLTIIGNLEGLQTLGQIQTVLVHQQARMMAMMGTFQLAFSTGQMFALAKAEAQRCITQARLRSIPRVNVYGLQVVP